MPKQEEKKEGVESRTRSHTPKAPEQPKPAMPKLDSVISKHTKGDSVKSELKKVKDGRAFNAEPCLTLDGTGVCRINTGKMGGRSQQEVYNYAFFVNGYIELQRGQKVKIKSTKKKREEQALFCGAVRKTNDDLFAKLNQGKVAKNGMFSVVGHVPDQCLYVSTGGETFNQNAYASPKGIGQAPGWMPMTSQANNLVSKIGTQTPNSSGQPDGPYLTKILVDGIDPTCALSIPAIVEALGYDPFPPEESQGGGNGGNVIVSGPGSKEEAN